MTNEERIERLEAALKKERRRWLWGQGLTLLACLVSFGLFEGAQILTAQGDWYKEIKANSFMVVNDRGQKRGELSVVGDTPRLRMHDSKGAVRVSLNVDGNEPNFAMYDSKGEPRALVSVFNDAPELTFYGSNGMMSAGLKILRDEPILLMTDRKGEPRMSLKIYNDAPHILMIDNKGNPRTSIGAAMLETKNGRATNYPESTILLYDANGILQWSAQR